MAADFLPVARLLRQWQNQSWFIYAVTALLSLIGSALVLSNMITTSSDGAVYLLYLHGMLGEGGLAGDAYGNPYYFLIPIKYLSLITGLSAPTSAYTFCTLTFAAASIGFVFVVRNLGAKPTSVWLAVFLIAIFPAFNEWKAAIFRDAGFWACSLFALGMLLKFEQHRRPQWLIFWLLFQLGAVSFRIEGIAFVWLPLIFVKDIRPATLKSLARPLPLLALGGAGLLVLFMLFGDKAFGGASMVDSSIRRFLMLANIVNEKSDDLVRTVLNTHSDQHALGFLLAGLTFLNVASIMKGLGFLTALLLALLMAKKSAAKRLSLVFWGYALTCVAVLFLFTLERQFMTERYATLLCLLIMIWGIFALARVAWSTKTKAAVIAGFALLLSVDSFISFGYSKNFVLETKDWVHENLAEDAIVLSSRRGFTYDLHRFGDNTRLRPLPRELNKHRVKRPLSFDYYVEFVHKNRSSKVANTHMKVIKEIANEEGYRALIYKVEK